MSKQLEIKIDYNSVDPSQSKHEKKGLWKSMKKQMSISFAKEVDPWFDQRKQENNQLQQCLDKSQKSIEKLTKVEKNFAESCQETSEKMTDYAGYEPNMHLSNMMRKFSSVLSKEASFVFSQTDNPIADCLNLYQQYAQLNQKMFDQRLLVLAEYDDNCKQTLQKKQLADKLKMNPQPSKIEQALSALQAAKQEEDEVKEQLQKMTEKIKALWLEFQSIKQEDFEREMRKYARLQIEAYQSRKRQWEDLVDDIKRIPVLVANEQLAERIQAQVL